MITSSPVFSGSSPEVRTAARISSRPFTTIGGDRSENRTLGREGLGLTSATSDLGGVTIGETVSSEIHGVVEEAEAVDEGELERELDVRVSR